MIGALADAVPAEASAGEDTRAPRAVSSPALMATKRTNDFEKAFQELEGIVKRLESEELPLDESLQLFEEGIKLSRFCHKRLEEVEKKIELILADAKGQPRTEPFLTEDDSENEEEPGSQEIES
jgi:exodeoxyribonuclease VII small subunit